ncbi:MAG: acyl carrier protein [Planctomycetes bacterium]|nr:acyl carrier protein [Planctomycetota bacterium]
MNEFMLFAEKTFRRSFSAEEKDQGIKALGITSLTFWDFIAVLEKEYDIELDMDDLIDLESLSQLEKLVESEKK